jgi:hypothetical protein
MKKISPSDRNIIPKESFPVLREKKNTEGQRLMCPIIKHASTLLGNSIPESKTWVRNKSCPTI